MKKKKYQYFQGLNYTLANEDTSLELDILPEGARHVVCVAGSGSRVIPLLAKAPEAITCVDLSETQLSLVRLRMAALRSLEYDQFLQFFGYPPKHDRRERRSLFDRLDLAREDRDFWRGFFESNSWESPLYHGKWERTFATLASINRKIVGADGLSVFSCTSLAEQKKHLDETFPHRKWALTLRLLGNVTVFNALLYRGRSPRLNQGLSSFDFYRRAYGRLFRQPRLFRENYFLQLSFFGRLIFQDGLPTECDETVFRHAKKNAGGTQVRYLKADAVKAIASLKSPADFVSLSDIASYFDAERDKNHLREMLPGIARGGLVVRRSYLHVPQETDLGGFTDVSSDYDELVERESVGVYNVGVFRKVV